MEKLITPFGEIKILTDGKTTSFSAEEGRKLDVLCPHVLGRYRITVQFAPDGEEHTIACVFQSDCSYKRTPESGERLECQSFYNDRRFKLSIGLECEAYYIGDVRISDKYDYDVGYLENGMSFHIKSDTKIQEYVFGISWIDNVGWDDPIDDIKNRGVETWYGADPSLTL
ncbi:MAG: hypothetical protein IKN64_04110 [Desulfovibrio sp.]|nr:hypothetical protein [Desulfovibrio sp.]